MSDQTPTPLPPVALVARLNSLAREMGTVISVSERQSDPPQDQKEMIRTLTDWRKQLHDAADALQAAEQARLALVQKLDGERGVLCMTVARLGGEVEGRPTERVNFLQRIDALREIETQWQRVQAEIDAERALRMLAIRQRDDAEDEAAGIDATLRARVQAVVTDWRQKFPESALKSSDDYYAGQANGTLKCSDELAALLHEQAAPQ